MLGTQAVAVARLRRGPNRGAVGTLTVLGSLMVYGYLAERVVRQRFRDFDRVETTVAAAGVGLAAAMGVGGARALRRS